MAKWLSLFLMAAVIVGLWIFARQQRVVPDSMRPAFGKLDRGDIRVPITAAGLVEPLRRIEVKSKASGEVIDIAVDEGDYVRAGQVLVKLKRDDEQRSVDRAKFALERLEETLKSARVAVKTAETNVRVTQAQVSELEVQLVKARRDLVEEKRLLDQEKTSPKRVEDLQTLVDQLNAQLEAARARVANAEHAVEDAKINVNIQNTNVSDANKQLETALERLEETIITAKQDAIVTDVKVETGMLVQSGTDSFTGGSVVMVLADISKRIVVARVDEADYGEVLSMAPIQAMPEIEDLRSAASRSAEVIEQRSGVVTLTVDAFRDRTFDGLVERVEPQGRLNAGSAVIQFDVRVRVTDEEAFLLPLGTQAQVEFTVQSATNVLRVPAEAVKTHMDDKGVWVRSGSAEEERRRFVRCRFGITDGEFTELIATLDGTELLEGQEIYTKLPAAQLAEGT